MAKRRIRHFRSVFFIIAGILFCMLVISGRDVGHFPEKVWLHRCNSIEKLHEKNEDYPNIEVDLVFRRNRRFDVTHDIDTSFNLFLDSYFSYMQKNDGNIWLDIKNLNTVNDDEALAALDELTRNYRIEKDRLIIESSCWEALQTFTKSQYYTSLYVTYDSPDELEDDEIDSCIHLLQDIVDKNAVLALSFPGAWYSTIKEKLERPIDLLTWEHRSTQLELFLTPTGREMIADPQLKVILVKDKGRFHR